MQLFLQKSVKIISMDPSTSRFIQFIQALIDNEIVSSLKDYAQQIGISSSALTEIYKGRNNVGYNIIQKSVIHFNVSSDWIITGDPENYLEEYLKKHGHFEGNLKGNLRGNLTNKIDIVQEPQFEYKKLTKLDVLKHENELLKQQINTMKQTIYALEGRIKDKEKIIECLEISCKEKNKDKI